MVCIVLPPDRYTDIVAQRAIALLSARAIARENKQRAIALRDSYASRHCV
ncbi:hypothetical protein [Microcoleus sp. bin38.metabat.b11b12b14.051]|nr:hypothetical protein [Microcoleus sp. bin38.metabat.b11b12b14.051]